LEKIMENEHEVKEQISVDIFYPDHAPRKESALFGRTKTHLVDTMGTPCWVCGSKEGREVHHFHLEWADSDAADWDKVKAKHPNFDWSKFKSAEDFVDSEYNMMVLCEKHHRAKDHGIHLLPYPIWVAQALVKKGFVFSPDEQ
jgi:hypothetical protein